MTFDPRHRADGYAGGLSSLELFQEGRLLPTTSVRRPLQEAEIITYVREGLVAYEDSLGRSGIIEAGEFQRMTAGSGIRYSQLNPSPTDTAHIFQLLLRPTDRTGVALEPGHEQKRFGAAERRGRLRIVVSPDAREDSLRIHQDALIYSGLFDRGHHVVHELKQSRSVWLHIVDGEVNIGEIVLGTGDGVGVAAEPGIAFTARAPTEVLVVDLGADLEQAAENDAA
jgi:redox-sensitive bicupin YhaK (pirin superfamily)